MLGLYIVMHLCLDLNLRNSVLNDGSSRLKMQRIWTAIIWPLDMDLESALGRYTLLGSHLLTCRTSH